MKRSPSLGFIFVASVSQGGGTTLTTYHNDSIDNQVLGAPVPKWWERSQDDNEPSNAWRDDSGASWGRPAVTRGPSLVRQDDFPNAHKTHVSLLDSPPPSPLKTDPLLKRIADCLKKGVLGQCKTHPDEHPRYVKGLLCMQQQCPTCGQDKSKAHNRRISRWIGKIQQLVVMGMWTIELPEKYRKDVRFGYSANGLRDFRRKVLSVLAGTHTRKGRAGGFSERGLWSFHFFGDYYGLIQGHIMNIETLRDKPYFKAFTALLGELSALGCVSMVLNPNKPKTVYWHPNGERLGDQSHMVAHFAKKYGFKIRPYSDIRDSKWSPHLNVLDDVGFVSPETLEETKAAIRKATGIPDLIIRRSNYVQLPAEMLQKVRYVLRSTFLDMSWAPYMAHQLNGFVNMGRWGHWDGPEVWPMTPEVDADADALEISSKLESHTCPVPGCGSEFEWSPKPIPMVLVNAWGAVEVGNTGYYALPAAGAWRGHPALSPGEVAISCRSPELKTEFTIVEAMRLFFLRNCAEPRGDDWMSPDELRRRDDARKNYEWAYGAKKWPASGTRSIASDSAWSKALMDSVYEKVKHAS